MSRQKFYVIFLCSIMIIASCNAAISAEVEIANNIPLFETKIQTIIDQANIDETESYNLLGSLFFRGQGVNKDNKQAAGYFAKAVQRGSAEGMYNLAVTLKEGWDTTKDLNLAVSLFTKASELGDTDAMYQLGCILGNGEIDGKENFDAAFELFKKASEGGDGDSSFELGRIYFEGICVEQNFVKAKQYFEKGVKQGCPQAMNTLGYMLMNGKGCEKDTVRGLGLYLMADCKGEKVAAGNLGLFYEENDETKDSDLSTAFHYYSKGAKRGNEDAIVKVEELSQ